LVKRRERGDCGIGGVVARRQTREDRKGGG